MPTLSIFLPVSVLSTCTSRFGILLDLLRGPTRQSKQVMCSSSRVQRRLGNPAHDKYQCKESAAAAAAKVNRRPPYTFSAVSNRFLGCGENRIHTASVGVRYNAALWSKPMVCRVAGEINAQSFYTTYSIPDLILPRYACCVALIPPPDAIALGRQKLSSKRFFGKIVSWPWPCMCVNVLYGQKNPSNMAPKTYVRPPIWITSLGGGDV